MHPILARMQKAVIDARWDAVVAISPENVTYAGGFQIPSHRFIRHRHNICVVAADGRSAMLVVDMEFNTARRYVRFEDVRPWKEFIEDPMARLADFLRELGVDRGTVGIELNFLNALDFSRLQKALPHSNLVAAGHWFEKVRMVKVEEELDKLREVGRLAAAVHAASYSKVRAGDTERTLAGHMISEFYGRGGEQLQTLVVATGNRSGLPNTAASDRVMETSDLIRVDVIGTKGGYYSDIARTGVVGKPTRPQLDIWKQIMETHHALLEMVKPGTYTRDIYEAFKARFERYGLPVSRFVGHGLGIHIHEEPLIGFNSTEVLQENMVLCIEPFIFSDGDGYQVEDEVIVTANGYELISTGCPNDELLRTGA